MRETQRLSFLTSGAHAHLLTRTALRLDKTDTLTVTSDLPSGVLCLVGRDKSKLFRALGETGEASLEATELPFGEVRVLFSKQPCLYDGGCLTVQPAEDGSVTLLPTRVTEAAERERLLAMMGDLLSRLKMAESAIDELQHGADVIA